MTDKRQVTAMRRHKKQQLDRAMDRLWADIQHWDAEAMGCLVRLGYEYRTAVRLTGAWAAIRHEPMDDDQVREYLDLCLRWGACR